MSAGEHGGEHLLNHVFLSDDHFCKFPADRIETVAQDGNVFQQISVIVLHEIILVLNQCVAK